MGNVGGKTRDVPPFAPLTLYRSRPWDEKTARRLMAHGAIAPLVAGSQDATEALEECPICFLNYPGLNRAKCCKHGICTECLLQIVPDPSHPGHSLKCPFCNRIGFATAYTGPLTLKQRQELEEERAREKEAEDKARKVEEVQERERERDRQEKRAEAELSDALRSPYVANAVSSSRASSAASSPRSANSSVSSSPRRPGHHHNHSPRVHIGGATFTLGSREARATLAALEVAARQGSVAMSEDQLIALAILQSLQDQVDLQHQQNQQRRAAQAAQAAAQPQPQPEQAQQPHPQQVEQQPQAAVVQQQ